MNKKMVYSDHSGKFLLKSSLLIVKLTMIILMIANTNALANNEIPSDLPFNIFTAAGPITGHVTNTTGEPIQGATVRVKGAEGGTSTDSAGNFTITVPDSAVLVISYVGYTDIEVPTIGRTSVEVVLTATNKELEQVVVVGYGTQRKIDVTGSVATVRGDDISKQSSINPVAGLQGRVAGVQITNQGAPGASPQIRIRGLGTVYGNANPLYVVDGVWFNDVSFLNSEDIESINILKDASSQAIYGIRAANGVVLITTKKGSRNGKAIVNYNGFVGVQHVTNKIKLANAQQYAQMLNEKNTISTGSTTPLINPATVGEGTDWYDVVLRDALITNHQLSVSGGGEKSTYNFSLGYVRQEGIAKTNTFNRVTARFQNDFQVFTPLKIGYTITASGIYSKDVNQSIFYQAFIAPPIIPVKEANGSYGDPTNYPTGNFANPQATLDFFNQRSRNYRVTGNMYAELRIIKPLMFRTSIGGEFGENETRGYTPQYFATSVQNSPSSRLTITRGEDRNWIVENTLTYSKRFDEHNLTALVGQSAQRYRTYTLTGTALNVPNNSDADLYLRLGSTGNSNVTDVGDLSTIASYFGRVNYSFRDRYLLTASLRADGSSKFSGNERWGYFPSIGLGWVVSDEAFMEGQQIFDNLKLRGSWGKVGNASVPSSIPIQTVTQSPQLTGYFGNPSTPFTGASINTIVPPVLYWERGVGTDIGVEMAFLNSRLYVEAAYYNRKTEQAIFNLPILGSLGTATGNIIANQATFQNDGFELTVNWKDQISDDLSYNLSANFSTNRNKVLSTATGSNPIYAGGGGTVAGNPTTRTVVGQPIGQFFGYQVVGIFQDTNQVKSSAQPGARPGDFIFADVSGPQGKPDGQISSLDRVILGNPNPRYTYGLNTNWFYKSFDLMLDFQGVAGVDVYNGTLNVRYGNENYTKDFFENRWTGAGTSNTNPSANTSGTNLNPSSFFVEDGSYVRIRTAQLGYTLPTAITSRWKLSRLRVYVNAQNPLNIFKYHGFSPEVGGTPTNAGIDVNVYPLYATYNFGVNVTF
jgi:TonB-linked SusC/RagA family outer membrane protein